MKKTIYNIIIGILAVVSIITAIRSLYMTQSLAEKYIDIAIWVVFVADYIGRLFQSEDKKKFFIQNIIDLIAIIPFYSVLRFFRIGRIVRIARLLKFAKVFRAGSRSLRFFKRSQRFLNTNGFKYVLITVIGMIFISAILMTQIENMSFLDGLWWSIVTVTTVGYGDLSPTSAIGRILAVILMLFGIGLIGSITSTVTAFFLREEITDNEFVNTAIEKLKHFENLSIEEVKEITAVLNAIKNNESSDNLIYTEKRTENDSSAHST